MGILQGPMSEHQHNVRAPTHIQDCLINNQNVICFNYVSKDKQVRWALVSSEAKGFKSAPVFEEIKKALEKDGESLVKRVKGTFCFKVKDGPGGSNGVWIVDAKNGSGSVKFGSDGEPWFESGVHRVCTIVVSYEQQLNISQGTTSACAEKKADCTINITDTDLLNMMTGKLNPQQAFFQGKLKVSGNMGLAMKIREFQPKAGSSKL